MEKKKLILIVDDEEDTLKVLDKRLSENNYNVIAADNGYDAVDLAKKKKPGLIILDIMMPEIDGCEVAAILKQDTQTANIPIIFLTALYSKKEEAKKGKMIAGNIFLSKPFEVEELLKTIEKMLNSR
ncbi:MAG: response regulator [Candidatus Omnitrophica bacterium]|nr:response regulator [Candidatus Omnitrophota bacterium]